MLPEIDTMMNDLLKVNVPGAAVAVVKAGEVIHRQCYGFANLEWEIPMQPDTVFRLASITKQFTATAIMMLQEQGKLNVNEPFTQYLPNYPAIEHEVLIHHLLAHTSGIKDFSELAGFAQQCLHDMTPQAICDVFSRLPFDFAPGEQYRYNNSGFFCSV